MLKGKSIEYANYRDPFMDSNKPLGLGTLDLTNKSFGFEQSIDESCVYSKIKDRKVVFLILYVDDILIFGNDVQSLTSVKMWLTK